MEPIHIKGFLHFRDDLGDGMQSAVIFNACSGNCPGLCRDFRPLREHPFAEDTPESWDYTPEELISYLKEEKTLCYTKTLGISFLGKEPLNQAFFCQKVAYGIRELGMKLQIMTCASVTPTAFDLLFGLVDLFIVNYFSPLPKHFIPYPEYDQPLVTENSRYLDRKGISISSSHSRSQRREYRCRNSSCRICRKS